jgi:hypothetical protein
VEADMAFDIPDGHVSYALSSFATSRSAGRLSHRKASSDNGARES